MTDWTDSVAEASRSSPNVPLKQLLSSPAFIAKARKIYNEKKAGGGKSMSMKSYGAKKSPKRIRRVVRRSAKKSTKKTSGARKATKRKTSGGKKSAKKSYKKSSAKRRR